MRILTPGQKKRVSKRTKPYRIVKDDMAKTTTKYKPRAVTKYKPRNTMVPWGGSTRPRRPKYGPTRKLNAMTRPKSNGQMTTSVYTDGTTKKSKVVYQVFQQNSKNIMTGINSIRIESAYGKQAMHVVHTNTSATYATAVDNTASATSSQTDRRRQSYFFGQTRMESMMTNQDICTAFVDIYELTPRFHQSSAETPLTLWERGLLDQASTTSANAKEYMAEVGAKPFESKAFCIYFLVKHIRRVEMPPGSIHKHVTILNVNKKIQGELAASYAYMKGFAHHTMFVAGGTPINDNTTKTNVSTSSVSLDIVQRHTTEFAYVLDNATNTYRTNTLPVITTGSSLSDQIVTVDTSA